MRRSGENFASGAKLKTAALLSLSCRIGNRAEQSVLSLTRVEAGMLHDYRYVRFDKTRKVGVERYRFWNCEIVESDVPGAPGRHGQPIGTGGLPIGVKNCDRYLRVRVGRVQNTHGLMTGKLRFRTMAACRNVTFHYCPNALRR